MGNNMTFELTPEDLDTIGSWYDASAGESAHDRDEHLFVLLEKPYADMDGSRPDLSPLFRVTWPGGSATVECFEVAGEFDNAADSLMTQTLQIYQKIVAARTQEQP